MEKDFITNLKDTLNQATDDLLNSIISIDHTAFSNIQSQLTESIARSEKLNGLLAGMRPAALQGKMAFDDVFGRSFHLSKIEDSTDYKQRVIIMLESVLALVSMGENLLSLLQGPSMLSPESSILKDMFDKYAQYSQHYNELLTLESTVSTLKVVRDLNSSINAESKLFSNKVFAVVVNRFAKCISTYNTIKAKRTLSDVSSYMPMGIVTTMLLEMKDAIGFIEHFNKGLFGKLKAISCMVLHYIAKDCFVFVKQNIGTFIPNPSTEMLQSLGLSTLEVGYNKVFYPDQTTVGASRKKDGKAKGEVVLSDLHSRTTNPLVADVGSGAVLGLYLFALISAYKTCSAPLEKIFFQSKSSSRGDELDYLSLPAYSKMLTLGLSDQPDVFYALSALPAAEKLADSLNGTPVMLATIFSIALDYSCMESEAQLILSFDSGSSQTRSSFAQTMDFVLSPAYSRLLSAKQQSTGEKDFTRDSYKNEFSLFKLIELSISLNPLYSLPYLSQAVHDFQLSTKYDAPFISIAIGTLIASLQLTIRRFLIGWKDILTLQCPTIKQSGIFPATYYTAAILSSMYAFFCYSSYTAANLAEKNPSYAAILSTLPLRKDASTAASPTSGNTLLSVDTLTAQEFALVFSLENDIPALQKLIVMPFMEVVVLFLDWIDFTVQADKANTEKYSNITKLENIFFLANLNLSILKHNFADSIYEKVMLEFTECLRKYINQVTLYQFGSQTSWMFLYQCILQNISEGFQETDMSTRPNLGLKAVEVCIKDCNTSFERGVDEIFTRIVKHIGSITTHSPVPGISNDTVRRIAADLFNKIIAHLRMGLVEAYTEFYDIVPKCYGTSIKVSLSVKPDDLTTVIAAVGDKYKNRSLV